MHHSELHCLVYGQESALQDAPYRQVTTANSPRLPVLLSSFDFYKKLCFGTTPLWEPVDADCILGFRFLTTRAFKGIFRKSEQRVYFFQTGFNRDVKTKVDVHRKAKGFWHNIWTTGEGEVKAKDEAESEAEVVIEEKIFFNPSVNPLIFECWEFRVARNSQNSFKSSVADNFSKIRSLSNWTNFSSRSFFSRASCSVRTKIWTFCFNLFNSSSASPNKSPSPRAFDATLKTPKLINLATADFRFFGAHVATLTESNQPTSMLRSICGPMEAMVLTMW